MPVTGRGAEALQNVRVPDGGAAGDAVAAIAPTSTVSMAVKRHLRTITLVSAAVLFAFGVLLLMDKLVWLTGRLTDLLDSTHPDPDGTARCVTR